MQKNRKIIIPWRLSGYREFNGCHPLVMSLLQHQYSGFEFTFVDRSHSTENAAVHHAFNMSQLGALLQYHHPDQKKNANFLWDFMLAHLPSEQTAISASGQTSDLVFLHTVPFYLGHLPWILHIESFIPLFLPFIHHGSTWNLNIRETRIFRIIQWLFRSNNCKAIFSHIPETLTELSKAFGEDTITQKLHYIPLGINIPEPIEKQVLARFQKPSLSSGDRVELLFTNSYHQLERSFRLRGGAEVLEAFLELRKTHPTAHLTVVSSVPKEFEPIADRAESFGITWYKEPVQDETLFSLLLRADVFLLPAAALHSISALRAMYFGATLVASDAPGYQAYVDHGETGFLIPGRRDRIYKPDPELGWLQDNYASLRDLDPEYAGQLYQCLLLLCSDSTLRERLARKARKRLDLKNSFDGWATGFQHLIQTLN